MAIAESEFSWFIGEGVGTSHRGARRLAFMLCLHRTGPRVRSLSLGPTLVRPDELPFGLGTLVPKWLPIISPLRVDTDDRPLLMAAVYDLDHPEDAVEVVEIEVEHHDFDASTFSGSADGGALAIEAFEADSLPRSSMPDTLRAFYAGGGYGALLRARGKTFALELFLREAKAPVVYGDGGSPTIRHGDVETSYFQRSRLDVIGTVSLTKKDVTETVERFVGDASQDRQWLRVTSPQLKWMWPHLRLSNGTELMGYVIRDSSEGRWASPDEGEEIGRAGWLVEVDGSTRPLPRFDVRSVPAYELRTDRGLVPTRFAVEVPELDLAFTLEHIVKDPFVPMKAFGAVLDAGAWEGPARVVSGPVLGHAWVEVVNAATARLGKAR